MKETLTEYMLDEDLIKRFNRTVNDEWFALFKYRKHKDKNKWGCICSAMDWITVSVEHINSITPAKIDNMHSMEIYTFIASADIIVEAVQQLHRVLLDTSATLYKDDCEIFKGNRFNQCDLMYFKELRAYFGAHPVNGDEPNTAKNEQKHRYSSWSSTHRGDGTATVVLYSNQIGVDDIILTMNFAEVVRLAKKYYDYLEELIRELERQKKEWFETKRNEEIPKTSNPIDQLEILRNELKKRIDNEWYKYDIEEILLLLRLQITAVGNEPLVRKYREALESLIDKIYLHVQNMDFSDCGSAEILSPMPSSLPNGWGYWYEKLSSFVFGGGHDPWYWETRIVEIFSEYFVPEYETFEELYLLVNAALYDLAEKEKC